MEEDIKLVEKFIEYSNYEGYIDFNDYIGECDIRAIENLLKRYKELEETISRLFRIIEASIPISVIQNKIDEIQNYIDNSKYNDDWNVRRVYARKVLQELLEERNK